MCGYWANLLITQRLLAFVDALGDQHGRNPADVLTGWRFGGTWPPPTTGLDLGF
jgi:hypothetical protein